MNGFRKTRPRQKSDSQMEFDPAPQEEQTAVKSKSSNRAWTKKSPKDYVIGVLFFQMKGIERKLQESETSAQAFDEEYLENLKHKKKALQEGMARVAALDWEEPCQSEKQTQ